MVDLFDKSDRRIVDFALERIREIAKQLGSPGKITHRIGFERRDCFVCGNIENFIFSLKGLE